MIICQCNGVRDCEVRKAVQRGAATRKAVARACGAGGACGGCRPAIDEIIANEHGNCARAHQSPRAAQLVLVRSDQVAASG